MAGSKGYDRDCCVCIGMLLVALLRPSPVELRHCGVALSNHDVLAVWLCLHLYTCTAFQQRLPLLRAEYTVPVNAAVMSSRL